MANQRPGGFQVRKSARKGIFFVGFNPAVSNKAIRKINQQIRSWKLHLWSTKTLEELARWCNPVIRGWFNYYGRYHRSALDVVSRQLDLRLAKWAEWKYKKLKGRTAKAIRWVRDIKKREPNLFAHWQAFSLTAEL
ncbi:MAG: hypothetical protein GX295_11215 [Syntrophomonadaceae bacterium]|nr:hypothetical protein [Syntrophomonadaceae bacterium]